MASCLLLAVEKEDGYNLGLEDIELRLGLPAGDGEPAKNPGKQGFSETLDLKLNLPAVDAKEGGGAEAVEKASKQATQKNVFLSPVADPEKPPAPK